ncbi:MAG: DUF2723 domain-containing protein [candidate division Zixibacteria bacterium]|nr:DUF2723 domain-containing protein [candidate division Zixibacteria bacterium]
MTELGGMLALVAVSLGIYWRTLAKSVFWWDSGDLIANVSVLGIPHRPGFPLYILLAKLWSWIELGGSPAWRVNLFSAVCAALTLALVYLIFQQLTVERFSSRRQYVLAALVGVGVAAMLGFNYSFWIQAVRAEVYSLAVLLFALMLWLAVRIETAKTFPFKSYCFFFLLLGLSLTNHPAIAISTFPALLYLVMTSWTKVWNPRNLFWGIILFVAGLSVYLYLPLRSQTNPVFNWLNPADWKGYLQALYSSGNFSRFNSFNAEFLQHLLRIAKLFVQQLGIIGFVVALFGFWSLGPKRRRWLWFSILATLFNWLTLAALTGEFIPNNPDLHGYLLPSILVWCLAFGWGSVLLLNRTYQFFSASVFNRGLKVAVTGIGLIFILGASAIPFLQSRSACNLAANDIPEQYARQAAENLPQGAMVIIDNPNLDFLWRGLQYGEGFRTDLVIIDRALLGAGWYEKQLQNNYPEIFDGVQLAKNSDRLAFGLAVNYLNRGKPVYWEFTERDSGMVNHLAPAGYLCQVVKNPGDIDSVWEGQAVWEQSNLDWETHPAFGVDGDAQRVWSRILYEMGFFSQCQGKFSLAAEKYEKILEISPDENLVTYRLKQMVNSAERAQNQ